MMGEPLAFRVALMSLVRLSGNEETEWCQGTRRELVGEALGVIGSGFLFRRGARQLVGLIPVVGIGSSLPSPWIVPISGRVPVA
jgi:hypothetical protein